MKVFKIKSPFDGLMLETAVSVPAVEAKGIVQFSHGMAEHKERYFGFMNYLSENGYVCVINDHRGHGGSVKSTADYGYFYTEDVNGIVDDLYAVTEYIKKEYPNLPLYLFSHSMGTLVARSYLKKYDSYIDKLVLCGPPTRNSAVDVGLKLAGVLKHVLKEKSPNKILNNIAFASYNKGSKLANAWLSYNIENVNAYNKDPMCGFIFTTNGFINLLKLQKYAFLSDDWKVKNNNLPIFQIAGIDDPVIGSKNAFDELADFLKSVGYGNVDTKLYDGMKHEILNEKDKLKVYSDVLSFFNN